MDKFMIFETILISIIILCSIVSIVYLAVDIIYVSPTADNTANSYCKSLGFDQYKTYSRIGLWSIVPVGIKCEYAEKYTDLGVRTN